ncbi:uncharacterized protein LOC143628474 [Bidens hawaiensis]|uniref:uncharacterized protein LOC143628474 n=1 Tax=Bidens hawaiensis TaxID=980011 RepID=UPI00404A23C7
MTSQVNKFVDQRRCFNCNEIGHVFYACPNRFKNDQPPYQKPVTKKPGLGYVSEKKPVTVFENVKILKCDESIKIDVEKGLPSSHDYRWIMDSGASRQMTGTIYLLNDVKSIRGGCVGFARNQGGQIVGEGTLMNRKVTFENVNYISELENNMLSISQICDKIFSTHFTDRECLILKPGFKIPKEWILMRSSRENDLYVMNMSTTSTSSGSAQCFISRASKRESILWHRRMGHISVRKMNHLIHKNLVEGVNMRNFQLHEEYLDCKKGKRTKIPHPKKIVNSINLPFERLHMDLFGSVEPKTYKEALTEESWVNTMQEELMQFEKLEV